MEALAAELPVLHLLPLVPSDGGEHLHAHAPGERVPGVLQVQADDVSEVQPGLRGARAGGPLPALHLRVAIHRVRLSLLRVAARQREGGAAHSLQRGLVLR